MSEFFWLDHGSSEQLRGQILKSDAIDERVQCPVSPDHLPRSDRALASRVNPHLDVEVRHSKRDLMMIWAGIAHCLVHTELLAEIRSAGFTGYSVRPATVRFRDGFLSHEYQRLGIRGWGGLARPESGVKQVGDCKGCLHRRWSAVLDPTQLIDRNQWNGDDCFIVWPLPNFIFVSKRLAEFLISSKVRSCAIHGLEAAKGLRFVGGDGFIVGSLGATLPRELALKFGKPLGIV